MELETSFGVPVRSTGVAANGGDPPMGSRKAWQCTFGAHVAADFAAELATYTLKGVELVPV